MWIVLHDFLPRLIGETLSEELLRDGPQHYLAVERDRDPFIPFEFADAAPVPVFPDLVGFRPVPAERVVDWTLMFDFAEHGAAQRAKKIDGRLPRSLIELPVAITGDVSDGDLRSLAVRDLERGSGVSLPSSWD